MKKSVLIVFMFLLTVSLASAATLKGTIYNENLELEADVLIEIDTKPEQKSLTKDGTYELELSPGMYILTAKRGDIEITESIQIVKEGIFVYDIFLLPDFKDEDELWAETEEDLLAEDEETSSSNRTWAYIITVIIVIFSITRIIRARKRYGPLKIFRRNIKKESKKSVEQHKKELESEPGYIQKAVDIIKKHDGRISQKQLRKEMLYLSEAKVSLIVTELEHKGKVEKVKKGRGNVIILK